MSKNPRVLVLVNTLQNVNSFVYSNHMAFMAETIRRHPERDSIYFFTPSRMSIDMARNFAAKQAMYLDCDYLMFIDDDVLIPPDTLDRLIELDSDIAAGLVIIRGYPFNVMLFDFMEDSSPEQPRIRYFNHLPKNDDGSLVKKVKCAAVGFSCAMIKTSLLKKLEPPFFVTGAGNTEDVYFCLKALESFPETTIYADTSIQCGHMLNAEPIEWKTREKLQEFYKQFAEEPKKEEPTRKANFIEKVLANV